MSLRAVVAPIKNQRQGAPLVARNGTHDRTTARARRTLGKVLLRRKGSIGDIRGPLSPTLWLAILSLAAGYIADAIGFDGASEIAGLRLCGVDQAIGKAGAPKDGPPVMIHRGREDKCFEADVQDLRLIWERRDEASREAALGGEIRKGAHIVHNHLKARVESV